MVSIILAVLLCAARVAGVVHPAFQATAHIYVSWMLAAWWFGKGKHYLYIGVAMSILEVVVALHSASVF